MACSKIKMWHKTMQAHGISKHVLASFIISLVAHLALVLNISKELPPSNLNYFCHKLKQTLISNNDNTVLQSVVKIIRRQEQNHLLN